MTVDRGSGNPRAMSAARGALPVAHLGGTRAGAAFGFAAPPSPARTSAPAASGTRSERASTSLVPALRELCSADAPTVDRACAAVKIIWNATSLGGVESTMERRSVHPGQEHIPDGLIRMSVGCEDVEDLWADLEQALAA